MFYSRKGNATPNLTKLSAFIPFAFYLKMSYFETSLKKESEIGMSISKFSFVSVQTILLSA